MWRASRGRIECGIHGQQVSYVGRIRLDTPMIRSDQHKREEFLSPEEADALDRALPDLSFSL